MLSFVMIN